MGRYISNTNTNSYQDNELLRLKQGFAKNRKEFLTAGTHTWTIDHGMIVRVRVWGGGGGGGGGGVDTGYSSTAGSPGAGGGAGGAVEAILRLNAGTYNITVGAAGSGGSGKGSSSSSSSYLRSGDNGGSSSFHTYITCSGGLGGQAGYGLSDKNGLGGSGSFNSSDFDGFLDVDCRSGGAGGRRMVEAYLGSSSYTVYRGCAGGEGESGSPASYSTPYVNPSYGLAGGGGGGGGYNHPFIYGSGRGVGTGGNGGACDTHNSVGRGGSPGQPGAVVIEWN